MTKYLSLEEQYWKQKSGFKWYTEGDRNTSFYHNYVTGKTKKLHMARINDGDRHWLDNMENIKKESVRFYQNQFSQEGESNNFEILKHVPSMISYEKNMSLYAYPSKEEVKQAVFALSGDSVGGPEGYRVVHGRMENILPSLISSKQSGFVKGRSIFKNILLTQEIVSDIKIRGKPANIVVKLDMAKAYDKVSSKYLFHVLRSMGFEENFLNLIGRLISNKCYFILLKGQTTGFFKSTRGVKQGDPLSPTLFLLSVEVLLRALNSLFDNTAYVGYGMPKWSNPLNHLAYANGTIIFVSAHTHSLQVWEY
ncbi:uncharacterized protein LOC132611899 [Lycium barbarum]|uniref:uncharacterized protein LOC132611899 n=1 Tax=Lycium barbarum TaxID=112863 RepID=UPI00293F6E88|nr:uncharacterized protein LOC132611899 [Lycium barbarum]